MGGRLRMREVDTLTRAHGQSHCVCTTERASARTKQDGSASRYQTGHSKRSPNRKPRTTALWHRVHSHAPRRLYREIYKQLSRLNVLNEKLTLTAGYTRGGAREGGRAGAFLARKTARDPSTSSRPHIARTR